MLFLVAGDWRLACDVGADGVHVPESILKTGLVSPMLAATRSRILTASAHGTAGLHRASAVGADAVFLSPVHATASHTDVRPIGAMPFSAMIRHCRVPVYGLGGIDFSDVMQLQAMGAAGIAGISLAHGLL